MAHEERLAKRIKTEHRSVVDVGTSSNSTDTISTPSGETTPGNSRQKNATSSNTKRNRKLKPSSQTPNQTEPNAVRTFSQPSVICTGDKGMFVTCDRGREQKSLLEIHDLIQQYLEEAGLDASGNATDRTNSLAAELSDDTRPSDKVDSIGIEAEIASELAQLRNDGTKQVATTNGSRPMQLITLDIPCVSLVRFPPGSTLDPVDIVHKLCLTAADPAVLQKSRYIKRLTPISNLAKALSQGLEKICEDVLPRYFGPGKDENVKSTTFAIRPTIRNNDKLNRDGVIKLVATHIEELGEGQHKVDLKQYEKGVLVEVYRGWVGMCVVDNTGTGARGKGFEGLRRFNLAEIYANR